MLVNYSSSSDDEREVEATNRKRRKPNNNDDDLSPSGEKNYRKRDTGNQVWCVKAQKVTSMLLLGAN